MPSACGSSTGASRRRLPGVDLHYALKPLPHSSVINTLHGRRRLLRPGDQRRSRVGAAPGGAGPNAASTPTRSSATAISARPWPMASLVSSSTIPDELRKFVEYRNRCSLLIRVSFQQPRRRSICRANSAASRKRSRICCGSRPSCGSRSTDCRFMSARRRPARNVRRGHRRLRRADAARAPRRGHDLMGILDIGGGFPVDYLAGPAAHAHRGILRADRAR